MFILSQIQTNENEVIDCVERFFSKHHIGKFLSKCNGTKEKGGIIRMCEQSAASGNALILFPWQLNLYVGTS